MSTNRYVKQNQEGTWDVLKEGHRRSAIQAPSMQEAVVRARRLVRRDGGGEVRVINRAGKVTDTRTVHVGAAGPDGAPEARPAASAAQPRRS